MIADIYVEGDKQLNVAVVIEMEGKMERLKNKNILITGGTTSPKQLQNWLRLPRASVLTVSL